MAAFNLILETGEVQLLSTTLAPERLIVTGNHMARWLFVATLENL